MCAPFETMELWMARAPDSPYTPRKITFRRGKVRTVKAARSARRPPRATPYEGESPPHLTWRALQISMSEGIMDVLNDWRCLGRRSQVWWALFKNIMFRGRLQFCLFTHKRIRFGRIGFWRRPWCKSKANMVWNI